MTTCAILLCKDEADVIEYTIRYLLGQVDEVIVSDNGSTDGTREILARIAAEPVDGCWLTVQDDPDPAYHQAEKTSLLARQALEAGHRWVIPCDSDELWYAADGRRISDFLAGLAPDVAYVNAPLYNHLPTDEDKICTSCGGSGRQMTLDDFDATAHTTCPNCGGDGYEPNPFERIGWRQREHGALPKVACRLRPGLEIRQGNHSAWAPGSGLTTGGLCVRHYSWRSGNQYVQKIANGYRAYAATSLPDDVGAHWRMFGSPDDPSFVDRVREHFYTWFFIEDPQERPDLIYDPAPYVPPENGGETGGRGVVSAANTPMEGDRMSEFENENVEHVEQGAGTDGQAPVEPVEGQEEIPGGETPAGAPEVAPEGGDGEAAASEGETGTPGEAPPAEAEPEPAEGSPSE